MHNHALLSAAFIRSYAPALSGGGNQQLARGSARHSQVIPAVRCAAATPNDLATVAVIERRLFDRYDVPVDVEALGNDHRECGFHTLPGLRVLTDNSDSAIGVDADIQVRSPAFCIDACVVCRVDSATANDQSARGEHRYLQEGPSIHGCAGSQIGHAAPPSIAARLMALRIR